MTTETRCCKVLFPNYSKNKSAEYTLVPPLWGTRDFWGAMVKGGYTPCFSGRTGYRPNTAAGGARTCLRLPQIQFWRASNVPANLADHARPFLFFARTLLGLTGPRRTRGLRDPPFWPHVGGRCPRKSTKFMYYPSVTILSPHLTEIIPRHDHLWQPQKQV